MTDTELLEATREIIAKGCSCDRGCEDLPKADFFCGCQDDAREIIELVRQNDRP